MQPRYTMPFVASVFGGLIGCAPHGTSFAPQGEPPSHAPNRDPAYSQPFTKTVSADLLDASGTGALWFKLDAPRPAGRGREFLVKSDTFEVILDSRESFVFILLHVTGSMNGPDADGESGLYWLAAAMTHLNADQWYYVAWTWSANTPEYNGLFVDGVRQIRGADFKYPGQIRPAGHDVQFQIGFNGVTVSSLRLYRDPLNERQLARLCRAAGHTGYTTEGLRFTGETFIPEDVNWDRPAYRTDFDNPSELDNWQLEGGYRASIDQGQLLLENAPPDEKGKHMVCWLKEEMPANFLMEFKVRPEDRDQGLNIVFFNARGTNKESIFDPALAPRDGTFKQYITGDIYSYHVSYWAAGRGTANVRKNPGFDLVAIGKDLVCDAPKGSYQTVRIYKRDEKIRLMVDNVVAVACDDDGTTHGPIHHHPGWIGLRQMGHTGWARYDDLTVWQLAP